MSELDDRIDRLHGPGAAAALDAAIASGEIMTDNTPDVSDTACDIVIVDLPNDEGARRRDGDVAQVYVRRWASGEYEADWRPNRNATWRPVKIVGGDFRVETVE